MATPKAVIFIGPQGSGKGTQAKILSEKINGILIGTGNIFREIATEDSEFGRYIKDVTEQGLLVGDSDVQKAIEQKVTLLGSDHTLIFDGIPRNLSQAQFLAHLLEPAQKEDIITVHLSILREETLKRLMLRKRTDDTSEAIAKRLDLYETETLPVLDFLKDRSDFHEINGEQSIEAVASDIAQIFNK